MPAPFSPRTNLTLAFKDVFLAELCSMLLNGILFSGSVMGRFVTSLSCLHKSLVTKVHISAVLFVSGSTKGHICRNTGEGSLQVHNLGESPLYRGD